MKGQKFIKIYLIIALILGVLGFIDTSLTISELNPAIYTSIVGGIVLLYFFFNIITIPILIRHQAKSVYYVLPIYHVLIYLLLFGISLIFNIFNLVSINIWYVLIAIGFLTAAFEIGFSIYLIKKINVPVTTEHTSRLEPQEQM